MIIPGRATGTSASAETRKVMKDEEGITTFRDLGQNMAWLLKKLNS